MKSWHPGCIYTIRDLCVCTHDEIALVQHPQQDAICFGPLHGTGHPAGYSSLCDSAVGLQWLTRFGSAPPARLLTRHTRQLLTCKRKRSWRCLGLMGLNVRKGLMLQYAWLWAEARAIESEICLHDLKPQLLQPQCSMYLEMMIVNANACSISRLRARKVRVSDT